MFLSYYGLREQPFGVTPDPRYLYQSAVHREALASLVYGIEAELGFTSLIAEPGMGKTTLLYYLLSRYRANARTAFVFETQCNSRELLQHVFTELEISTNTNDQVVLRNRFKEFLITQARAHRRVLLIFDEAQNLSNQVLETVRLLSNFETSQAKLLHILLAGQPQLADKLARPELKQLRQRVAMFTRLAPFSVADTESYIEHRLAIAGYAGAPLFTANAYELITADTRGIPREINRICFNALSLGCALQKKVLDAEVLREVCLDLRITSDRRTQISEPGPPHTHVPAAVASGDTEAWRFAAPPPLVTTPDPDTASHNCHDAANTAGPQPPTPIPSESPAQTVNRAPIVPPAQEFKLIEPATSLSAPEPESAVMANRQISTEQIAAGTSAPQMAANTTYRDRSRLMPPESVSPASPADTQARAAAAVKSAPVARVGGATGTPTLRQRQAGPAVPVQRDPRSRPSGTAVALAAAKPVVTAAARRTAAALPRTAPPPLRGMPSSTQFNLGQLAAFGVLCPSLLGLLIYLAVHYGWMIQAMFFDR